ncbi:MAG: hypothetical protein OXG39_03635 [Chloroflexi bacterium]|nr:hypothetical protein [Chloroflexota bacterium]
MIRNDWAVICRDYLLHNNEPVLWRVLNRLNVPFPLSNELTTINLKPLLHFVSFWVIEDEADQKIYPAVARWLAPGGEKILRETPIALDFRHSRRFIYQLRVEVLDIVGPGHYEYHIEVPGIADWGILSRNSFFITNEVQNE